MCFGQHNFLDAQHATCNMQHNIHQLIELRLRRAPCRAHASKAARACWLPSSELRSNNSWRWGLIIAFSTNAEARSGGRLNKMGLVAVTKRLRQSTSDPHSDRDLAIGKYSDSGLSTTPYRSNSSSCRIGRSRSRQKVTASRDCSRQRFVGENDHREQRTNTFTGCWYMATQASHQRMLKQSMLARHCSKKSNNWRWRMRR